MEVITMRPMIMWNDHANESDLGEFDQCDMCGHVTSLLVIVRVRGDLFSFCGKCPGLLEKGYSEMLRRRVLKGTA